MSAHITAEAASERQLQEPIFDLSPRRLLTFDSIDSENQVDSDSYKKLN